MQHFSCDLCSKDMTSSNGQRYIIKVEAWAASDPHELTDEDLDLDPIADTAQLLSESNDAPLDQPLLPMRQEMRFDLCAECYRKFSADPLGKDQARKFAFSAN